MSDAAPRKRGRPRKPEADRINTVIAIALSNETANRVYSLALRERLSVSELLRRLLREPLAVLDVMPAPFLGGKNSTSEMGKQVTYLIRDTQSRVKVGVTTNLKRRLTAFQIASPDYLTMFGTVDGNREQEFKKLFASRRLRGEWYRWDAEMERWLIEAS